MAAGLVAMTGPGLVIQLSDSSVSLPQGDDGRDYLVSGQDVLAVVEELWLAGAEGVAVNGERVTPATAIVDIGGSVLVNSAYLAPPYQVAAIGPADMFDRLTASPGFIEFIRARAETFGIGVDYATLEAVDLPAYAGAVNLRYGRPAISPAPVGRALMRKRSARIAVGAVLCILGFLVVVQLNSQAADKGLNGLSVQELTELVASLTTRNNQLREEIRALDQQHDAVAAAVQRGDTSAVQVRADLNRVLGWSGRLAVTGAGIRVTVTGELPGDALAQLLNELRNAGAEAVAIGGTRIVAGDVPNGPAGDVLLGDAPLADPIELVAVGQPQTLAGSLTRAGGPIAQLAARFPDAVITVSAEDRVAVPATMRSLAPVLARPRL